MGRMKQIEAYIRMGGDEAMEAVSQLLPRWIPVEERLPEERVEVLLHYDDGSMEVGKYLGLGGVTHWMPLPEPPEVK